jgi:hypothetical protein
MLAYGAGIVLAVWIDRFAMQVSAKRAGPHSAS